MKLNWEAWLYGLISGFVGGGAGSIGTAFGVMHVDFDHFNPGSGLHNLLAVMGYAFVSGGVITAAAYLAKSPLPPPAREVWTDEQRQQAAKTTQSDPK